MALLPSTPLGPYEIRSLVGSGGMGEVYRARDTRLVRDVAIKVLPAEYSADPDRLRRFEQEARAAAALNHPNILAVFDVGTDAGTSYVVSDKAKNGSRSSIAAALSEADLNGGRMCSRTPRGNRALASILFVDAVTAGDTIYASLEAARHEVGAAPVEHFPPVVQDRLAAQLLGRAIAHELGHSLLSSTGHSRKGLMRESFGGRDLLTPEVGAFRLEAEQAAALATRMRSTSRRAASPPGGR